jgi:hypothetical protein
MDFATTVGYTGTKRIFPFLLNAGIDMTLANNVSAWTGINSDWTNSNQKYRNWTSNKNNILGIMGFSEATDETNIQKSGTGKCGQQQRLYCVEQSF